MGGHVCLTGGTQGCKGDALAQGPGPWGLASPPMPHWPPAVTPKSPKGRTNAVSLPWAGGWGCRGPSWGCPCPAAAACAPPPGVPRGRTCRLMHFSLFVLSLPLGAAPPLWGAGGAQVGPEWDPQGSPLLLGPQYPPAKLLHGSLLLGGCAGQGCCGVLWGAGLGCCPLSFYFCILCKWLFISDCLFQGLRVSL